MAKRPNKLSWAGALLVLSLAGCGSSTNSAVFTGSQQQQGFVVTEPATISRDGDVVDSIELEAFDAQGNKLQIGEVLAQSDGYTPVVVPFGETMNFPPLPQGTTSVQLDYMRNGGYTLFRAEMPASAGGGFVANPSELPVDDSTTRWNLTEDGNGGFDLKVTPNVAGEDLETRDFIIKGVCYSPCPINVLGDGAPNIGDFFFDVQRNPDTGNVDFFNWFGLWGSGSLGDGFFARDHIKKIRELNANTIRTYSMLSRQQNDRFTNPELPEFPDPTTKYHFQHKDFLDKCWNNGVNPVYVIVGIPLPSANLYLSESQKPGEQAKLEFYDFVLRETIEDLANHPAVLGFTTQNELNRGEDAFPNGSGGQMKADVPATGAVTEESDFYWGQVKEYTDYAKTTAPDKLIGICVHNFREIAQYSSKFPESGPTYLEQLTGLDFVGINTYETFNYDTQYNNGWGAVTGPGRKAVLFSELGFPATTRDANGDPATIHETAESRRRTADLVSRMLPQAYSNAVSIGACYFEFSDEWWKQVENTKEIVRNGQTVTVRATDQWYGGNRETGFPNGYWDEEGFGLYSISRFPGLQNSDPVLVFNDQGNAIGPDRRLDVYTERKEIADVVRRVFNSITP